MYYQQTEQLPEANRILRTIQYSHNTPPRMYPPTSTKNRDLNTNSSKRTKTIYVSNFHENTSHGGSSNNV